MDDMLGDFPNGAVLVENGIIKAVGNADDLVVPDAEIIDAKGGVIMPGMIDTHRHTFLSLMRGVSLNGSLFEFLSVAYKKIMPAMSLEEMRLSCLVGGLEAIDNGVTTILDPGDGCTTPKFADACLKGLSDSGIRGFWCYGMSDDAYDEAAKGKAAHEARLIHVDKLRKLHLMSDNNLLQVGLSISHPGTVPFNQMATEIRFADQRKMLCCSHSAALKGSVLTKGLEERADHGLMLPGHVYIHCTNLTSHEIKLIAETGGKIAIAPETEMQMGMGIPPFRLCIDNGLNPSISIDTSSAVAPDLLSQMRLALQMQRCLDHEASHAKGQVSLHVDLTVRDALVWGTRNGAEALGLADKVGTLTPGKRADVVFISSKRWLTPAADPLGTILTHSTGADIDTVMVDGEVRKRNGQLVGVDVDQIRADAATGFQRIVERLGDMQPPMEREQLREFLIASERSTRSNLAKAYAREGTRGDWLRGN
ncbi:Metallo-dependent hydrolase [Penicillium cf. griseofulvum]|uniref:Metallo-dependent hydrolase n=1 Tax=Penicillium cf. griseofulvum TaxID=2972120 RepID=A0A9W9INU6_9EURO|nr:Metallo-dependent hydrolase [Penicillium cf. griseofulvum]KAJ5442946.1 Metallo-dependent hydrolase [Penicillium cf. griseofulvum]KAJ5451604.1 Metallo-dependent hydrolase [Penicillium cf. griseofulvum]